ncbi:Calcineurin-like phosphoesterase domain ApaH type [Arabidopsis thaliana x Arabidopsis arenosa]|uniref:Purple acid phosphatase n=1 Tax=Arabidopsis thaliana x Arabidopsis arenosa TaxID=1240361 RepID=A0A8T2C1A7_9BRAS|nr:Calcineurin-like phosphoesterase domain ApaH type [Arabidopsis thaliana x Arabidopsis arenosa]
MAALKHKPVNLIFYVYNLIIIFSTHSSTAELRRLLQPAKPDGTVSFLVIGDWGRRGSYNQSQVALQMGEIGEKLDIDFVISTGDNFYDNGLASLHDPLFQDSFSSIYTTPSLQKPWYSVLGNHDYRGDVRAQLSPMLRALDNRWVCMRSFIVNAEIVDFLFVDTTPFVDKYFIQPNKHVYDWSGVLPRQTYLNNLLKEVDVALRESVAKWKIVIGHHTIKSAGHHGNTIELEKHLLPILQANEVDLYVNGHDHCLEHISSVDSNIQFMTSGGGSKAWKGGDVNYLEPQDQMKFYYDGQGFMSVHVSEAELRVVFYDVFGHVLHHWKTYKEALYFAS